MNPLRSPLRFLQLGGVVRGTSRRPCRRWPAGGTRRCLPRWRAGDVAGLLSSCEKQPAGLRDFAILTLLARLGLRSCEVAGLELDDIDWRRGELRVRGKGRGGDPLPLLNEAGEAVACYLHDGRPAPSPARSS